MYKVVILEDEKKAESLLKECLNKYSSLHSIDFKIFSYNNPFDLLESFPVDADMFFLDIEMAGMNGMEVAKKLRSREVESIITFVTNYSQFALDGYEVSAFDYILKPLDYDIFSLKLDRIVRFLNNYKTNSLISLDHKSQTMYLHVDDILYVEVFNHDVIYHLENAKEYKIRKTLSKVYDELSSFHFAYCNSCYIVNLKYVTSIKGNEVIVKDKALPISKSKYRYFLQELAAYHGGIK